MAQQYGLDEVISELKSRGIEEGKKEADRILADAKKEAEAIVEKAKAEADKIVSDAKAEAEKTKKQMDAELKSAADNALTAFRQAMLKSFALPTIEKEIEQVVSKPQFLESLISELIRAFASNGFKEGGIQVLLPAAKQKELESYVVSRLKAKAGSKVQVVFDDGFSFGFQIGPDDGRFVLDLSDDGFREIFSRFVAPRFKKYFETSK